MLQNEMKNDFLKILLFVLVLCDMLESSSGKLPKTFVQCYNWLISAVE